MEARLSHYQLFSIAAVCFPSVDTRVFMTIAIDLVLEGIQEPVRFLVETRAKIFPTGERFWYFTTKPHVEQFIVKLKEAGVSFFIYCHSVNSWKLLYAVFVVYAFWWFQLMIKL